MDGINNRGFFSLLNRRYGTPLVGLERKIRLITLMNRGKGELVISFVFYFLSFCLGFLFCVFSFSFVSLGFLSIVDGVYCTKFETI